jgi:prevent-host-death family protein
MRTLAPIQNDDFELVRLSEHAASLWAIASGRAKDLFGPLLERAAGRPVVITKKDRPAVVVVAAEQYLRLLRDHEELLTQRALEIERTQGYIGEEATAEFCATIERAAAQG